MSGNKTRSFTIPNVLTSEEANLFKRGWVMSSYKELDHLSFEARRKELPVSSSNPTTARQWGFEITVLCTSDLETYEELLTDFEKDGYFGKLCENLISSSGNGFIIQKRQ
jgi:hypothetical protein